MTTIGALLSTGVLLLPASSAIAHTDPPVSIGVGESQACSTTPEELPLAEGKNLNDNVVYETVYRVNANCDVAVVKHAAAYVKPKSIDLATQQTTVTTTKVIHSSQTLQDIVRLDISRFRYAHETAVREGTGLTYVKFTDWRSKGAWDGNLAWNHVTSSSYGSYTSSYTTQGAIAKASGKFHSDFLWCNLQAGQDFTMFTELSRSPSSWNASFSQSRTCTGTFMATAKKIDTTRNLW